MTASLAAPLNAIDLRCNGRAKVLGCDVKTPTFSWALRDGGPGARQSAWRLRVGTTPDAADVWDSGKVTNDRQLEIPYGGAALSDRTRYHWQVQVWDATGQVSDWSEPAWFETAFFNSADFAGEWISADPVQDDERCALATARWLRADREHGEELCAYRVAFALAPGQVAQRAQLHVYADGHANPWSCGVFQYLSVNGTRPESCGNMAERAVMTFEIAEWLRPGDNAVTVKTWVKPDSAFIARVVVTCTDGSVIDLPTTATSWQWHAFHRDGHLKHWDAASSPWSACTDVGAFGKGPWPADDVRNRADRLLPALVLRHRFSITKPVLRARIYATALGSYDLSLDGQRVGDRILAPGWTDYRLRLHYQCEDVTADLQPGEHELIATVGDGWWSGHLATPFGCSFYGTKKALKLALHVDYADGSSAVIHTQPGTWEAATGPIRLADLMEGQITDLTRDVGPWRPVTIVDGPIGSLQVQPDEPIRMLQELPPQTLLLRGAGRVVVDFGQNLVGVVRLRVRAPRGTRLSVRHTEVLDLKGEPWVENLRSAIAIDEHVCSGGDDDFLPIHTFHGFRYAEISGLPGGLNIDQVSAQVFASDTPDCGSFVCDNPLLNRLQANIRWGQRGNFVSVPTDCPQRDERLGWTADTQVFARTAVFNADCQAFYRKYIDDLLDSSHPEGGFPGFAPTTQPGKLGAFGWADAGVLMPWWQWRIYGDVEVIRTCMPAMRKYLDARDAVAVNYLDPSWSFGDWVSPAPQTPNDVLAPIYHGWMHRLTAEMATAIGDTTAAKHHQDHFQAIRSAWRKGFLLEDGRCRSDTQAAYACAIMAQMLSGEEARPHFLRTIERHRWHLNTGFLGTYCLLPALSEAGLDDVAWQVLLQEGNPGWLYTVKNGATTMWERWNSYSPETGPVNIGNMNSYNHYAFGAVGEWMYAKILGIDRVADDVGCQRLLMRPVPGGRCTYAAGSWRSPRGMIHSSWSLAADGTFKWSFSIPPNCEATVALPMTPRSVNVYGKDPASQGWKTKADHSYQVGSGDWKLRAQF